MMEQTEVSWKFLAVRIGILAAMLIYVLIILENAAPIVWGAAWVPSDESGRSWFGLAVVVAVLGWADGWLLPYFSRRKPSSQLPRFIVRLSVFHGAALWGTLLSFKTRDARYTIVAVAVSSLMVFLLPTPKTGTSAALR